MESYEDFRVQDVIDTDAGAEWIVVYGTAPVDEAEYLLEADTVAYSGRSRLARVGVESGVLPYRSSDFPPGYQLEEAMRSRFTAADLDIEADQVGAVLALRNMYTAAGTDGPTVQLSRGDALGRLFAFDNTDVAVVTDRKEEYRDAALIYGDMRGEGGPDSMLRFVTDGEHPDLDTVVADTPYSHDQARIRLPVDSYAECTVSGEITVAELEAMALDDILAPAGAPPETVEPGVHYAYIEDYVPTGCNLWLTDPDPLSVHASARLIDADFDGEKVALEFLYGGADGEETPMRGFPEDVPAFAIR